MEPDRPWLPELGCLPPEHPFNKQWDVFNCRKKILLVCGSRLSGKTFAVLHRVWRHLWETPGARVAVFAKSKGLAKDGGSWQDLIERTGPEWMESGMVGQHGMPIEYTTKDGEGVPGPKQDPQTRTATFRIRNYFGGESECKLFSIDNDAEVASKVKNKSFSMIYFIELSMFKDKRILAVTLPCLRLAHLQPKNNGPDLYNQWIADTNPDEDLGAASWFYQEFYVDRLKKRGDSAEDRDLTAYFSNMEVIEMHLEDNPHITRDQVIILKGSCMGDQALYDSYVLGIHGEGGAKRNKFFAKDFIRSVHVVGGTDDPDDTDQIAVSDLTRTLFGGWDVGASVNHAAVVLDKRMVKLKLPDAPAGQPPPDAPEVSCWSVLDEVVSINERIGLYDFTQEFMRKQREIEARAGRQFDWMHWADDSAINVWRPSSESFDYIEILAASHNQIRLQGVEKPSGSVKARVRWIQKLLRENRLYVSARCVKVIAMLEACRRGDTEKDYVNNDEFRHVFDALSYPIYMECRGELLDEAYSRPRSNQRKIPSVVSV
jgi:hypothetical protein